MIRRSAIAAALAALCMAPAPAQVTGPLGAPPAASGQSASLIFDAMLAISRAAQANPQGAQAATFSYAQALQRYRAGDAGAASAAALQAIREAQHVPYTAPRVPSPVPLTPAGTTLPLYGALPRGSTPTQVDADAFLGLARDALNHCSAAGTGAAREAFARAATAAVKGDAVATRTASTAVINDCAAR